MRAKFPFILFLLVLLAQWSPQGETVLELETLRIEGNIYEPQVLFILEKPSIELITIEEKKHHDFLKDFDKPLLKIFE